MKFFLKATLRKAFLLCRHEVIKKVGFSLAELLIVVSILGILAAIAIPRFSNANTQHDLDNSARQLVADLRWTSQMAANSIDTVKIVFVNAAPYGYYVVQGSSETVIKPTQSFPSTVQFAAVTSPISFDLYGKTSTDVAITIQNTAGQFRIVNIDYMTGRVRMQ